MNAAERILVVDDDRFNCTLMRELCETAGFSVVEAHDGIEALERIRAEQPQLVLLDIMMGGKDGFQVLQELRRTPATARLPVIVVTALSDLDSKVRGLSLGADDYVTKPFHSIELQTRIRIVLDAHRYRAQLQGSGQSEGARLPAEVRGCQELAEDLEIEFRRSERYHHPLSLGLILLDDNGPLPAEPAQAAKLGDELLSVFRRTLRVVDRIYRLQHDQFVLLLPETPLAGARVALRRVREGWGANRAQPPPTFSAAITHSPHPSINASQQLLEQASRLLQDAHWKGGDRLLELPPA